MKWAIWAVVLVCGGSAALAWTDEGHEAIGAMADQLLAGTRAAAQVRGLLGNESLATASIWADSVKYRTNQWPEAIRFRVANPNHAAMHFTDIPFEEARYRDDSIGARPDDVVHAIDACILILRGKPDAQSVFNEVNQKIALRLLAHYVGDIHQPLHVGSGYLVGTKFIDPNGYGQGYEEDRGGNELFFGTNRLHLYWDLNAVRQAMAKRGVATPQAFAAKLLTQPAPLADISPLLDWPRDWASESLALSSKAHDVRILEEKRRGQPLHWQDAIAVADSKSFAGIHRVVHRHGGIANQEGGIPAGASIGGGVAGHRMSLSR